MSKPVISKKLNKLLWVLLLVLMIGIGGLTIHRSLKGSADDAPHLLVTAKIPALSPSPSLLTTPPTEMVFVTFGTQKELVVTAEWSKPIRFDPRLKRVRWDTIENHGARVRSKVGDGKPSDWISPSHLIKTRFDFSESSYYFQTDGDSVRILVSVPSRQ